MKYLSLFSGIGGLERQGQAPLLYCEQDPLCRLVLARNNPSIPIVSDVRELKDPPQADLVVGGWPCQDLSSAGRQQGLSGERSALFWEMLRVANAAGAHTLVGENVPNLLTIHKGLDFNLLLNTLADSGFSYIGWRVLNARAFGLPQDRRRLFIVASKHAEIAWAIHSEVPPVPRVASAREACGFYWTGGTRSICFSRGFAPPLKIGASDGKGRAPIAALVDGLIRKLSSGEFLRLQGFEEVAHPEIRPTDYLRMAGNAVAAPVGRFVMNSVTSVANPKGIRAAFGYVAESGVFDRDVMWVVENENPTLVHNLGDFLDDSGEELSAQACAGLLVRSIRSGKKMPLELFSILERQSRNRTNPLRPSRSNSFDVLDRLSHRVTTYEATLQPHAT